MSRSPAKAVASSSSVEGRVDAVVDRAEVEDGRPLEAGLDELVDDEIEEVETGRDNDDGDDEDEITAAVDDDDSANFLSASSLTTTEAVLVTSKSRERHTLRIFDLMIKNKIINKIK